MKYLATGLKLKMDPGMHGGFQLKFLDVVFLDPFFIYLEFGLGLSMSTSWTQIDTSLVANQ